MPTLRFVLGRAGTGKTHHCLEQIRAALRAEPDGHPLLLLAPEQSTFQLERALVTTPGIEGMFRGHVLSFRRLAHRLNDELGGRMIPPAGNLKRLLILREILSKRYRSLQFYGASARTTGFAQAVDAILTEWRRYEFVPEQAEALAAQYAAETGVRKSLSLKLHDLALIYRDYREATANRFLDPEDYLERFAAMAGRSQFLRGAEVWVDGFADFTGLEHKALSALLQVAAHTEVALCLDPQSLEGDAPDEHMRPFAVCEGTFWKLKTSAEKAGIKVLDPLHLKDAHRFLNAPMLGKIERHFFGLQLMTGEGAGPTPKDSPTPKNGSTPRVVRAQSLQAEVEFVAGEVLRMAREEGFRYREMAIVTRNLEECHDYLRTALARLRIPFFMDRQRQILCHPLSDFLLAVAEIVAGGWRTNDVVQALKSGLLPLTRDETDQLENYALEFGLDGSDWQDTARWKSLAHACKKAIAPLTKFEHALGKGRYTTADAFIAALQDLLQSVKAMDALKQWEMDAESLGDVEMSAEHSQMFELIKGLFNEWSQALGSSRLTRRECADLLEEGLSALQLRLTPPALDHLLVGSIERSRHPDLRVVFLIGMNMGVFPARPSENLLLNDADRSALVESGVELSPSARERLLNEPFLAYIALTRASERLIITHSQSDAKCRAIEVSPYLERVCQITGAAIESADHEDEEGIVDLASLGKFVARGLGQQLQTENTDVPPSPLPELLNLGRKHDDAASTFSKRIQGAVYRNGSHLTAQNAARLLQKMFDDGCGITSLELFAKCPFHFFLNKGLGLKPRSEATFETMDRGSLLHDVLKVLFEQMSAQNKVWHEVAPDELRQWTEEALANCVSKLPEGILQDTARNRHMLRSLQRTLHQRVRILAEESRASCFRQVAAEASFGHAGAPIKALEIPLSNGTTLKLRGSIDRMDLCAQDDNQFVRIIDFKSSAKAFDVCAAYHGIQLQLPAYLAAVVNDRAELSPAGFFFAPITPEKTDIMKFGETVDFDEDAYLKCFKGSGLFVEPLARLVDSTVGGGQSSLFWNLRLKNDGSCYQNSGGIGREQLEIMLKFVQFKLRALAQDILDGQCAISPYQKSKEDACAWCEMNPVCRFDSSCQPTREIETMKRDEALIAMGLELKEGASA